MSRRSLTVLCRRAAVLAAAAVLAVALPADAAGSRTALRLAAGIHAPHPPHPRRHPRAGRPLHRRAQATRVEAVPVPDAAAAKLTRKVVPYSSPDASNASLRHHRHHRHHPPPGGEQVQVRVTVPPRRMWGWGGTLRGYCGETSFQSHGLLHGNWISSEITRHAADGRELLVAVNDVDAAAKLHFAHESWDWRQAAPQAHRFLAWVRKQIDAGAVIATGFFVKEPNGDGDYDHIMPIIGYDGPADGATIDVLYFNDLWNENATRAIPIAELVQSRSKCSAPAKSPHPWTYCLPDMYDYAIALLGNVAPAGPEEEGAPRPMRLAVPAKMEPDYGEEDDIHSPIRRWNVTATVGGLRAGNLYAVVRFDNPWLVPHRDFLGAAYARRFEFVAPSSTVELPDFDEIASDSSAFYRCVAVPAA